MSLILEGYSISATAENTGYCDIYQFSRVYKNISVFHRQKEIKGAFCNAPFLRILYIIQRKNGTAASFKRQHFGILRRLCRRLYIENLGRDFAERGAKMGSGFDH